MGQSLHRRQEKQPLGMRREWVTVLLFGWMDACSAYRYGPHHPVYTGYGRLRGGQGRLLGVPSAVVNLTAANNSGVTGTLEITMWNIPTPHIRIEGSIRGLTHGYHGFHVHMTGDISDDCKAAKGHFNPSGAEHSSRCKLHATSTLPFFVWLCPGLEDQHAGDLGNIFTPVLGDTHISFVDNILSLGDGGVNDIEGRAIVVHAGEDDLGLGTGDKAEESKKTGNAGARVACGVITMV